MAHTQHTPHNPLALWMTEGRCEAGVDEAGRGCLAGPVMAAAVILPPDISPEDLPGLDDSKRLSEKQREALAPLIKERALVWAVGEASVAEIDQMNILNAAMLAMHRAIGQLSIRPEFLLIDGNKFVPYYTDFSSLEAAANQTSEGEALRLHNEMERIGHQTVVGGDGRFMSIAAASVLAKTSRDALMRQLAEEFPGYAWEVNKGYGTKAHYEALKRLGPTVWHRRSFRLE